MIDAHVHLYDPRRPQGVPYPNPANKLIYRPMLPDDLRPVAEPVGITGAVFVESSPWVEDNQWALDLVANEPYICAIVGNLDPEEESFPALIERFSRAPLFRGIRIRQGRPLNFQHPLLPVHLRLLAELGRTLDFAVRTAELPLVAKLAAANPGLKIMVDHLGFVAIDGQVPDADWIKVMSTFESLPNVSCKVSRFTEQATTKPAPLEFDRYAPIFDVAWKAFGPDRLTYGSNWPPCLEAGDYCATTTLLRDYLRERHPSAASRIMGRNAASFYGGPRFSVLNRSAVTQVPLA